MGSIRTIGVVGLSAALLLLRGPAPTAAQGSDGLDACWRCAATTVRVDGPDPESVEVADPGSPEARALLLGRLGPHVLEPPIPPSHPRAPDEMPVSCGELALAVGGAAAAVGLLFAWALDALTPDDAGTGYYVLAGSTMFAAGAIYTGIRCGLGAP